MNKTTRFAFTGWLTTVAWPAFAAGPDPGIGPTILVGAVAFAVGVGVGYVLGKNSGKSSGGDA
jgi:hypothetical protein